MSELNDDNFNSEWNRAKVAMVSLHLDGHRNNQMQVISEHQEIMEKKGLEGTQEVI